MLSFLNVRKHVRALMCALALGATFSMVTADYAEARRDRGGAHQRFSGGGGKAAHSRPSRSHDRVRARQVDRSGNFGGGLRRDRSTRQGARTDRQGQRNDLRGDRVGGRQEIRRDRVEGRGDARSDRQDGRTDRTEIRQENRTERQGNRQDGRSERVEERARTRREIADDISDNRYWSNYRYDHYHYWHDDDNDAAWALFAGLAIGAFVASLPPRYETVTVAGSPYYYADGTYYQASGDQYEVVPAPVGATVENAPSQVTNVYVNGEEYGYANGAYYDVEPPADDQSEPTFDVVAPPIGATVPELPADAEKQTVGDQDYFVYADTWYKPFYSGSDVVYMVVEAPS